MKELKELTGNGNVIQFCLLQFLDIFGTTGAKECVLESSVCLVDREGDTTDMPCYNLHF